MTIADCRAPRLPQGPLLGMPEECRKLARHSVGSADPELVEFTALQLMETYVESHPDVAASAAEPARPGPPGSLTGCPAYLRGLAAAAGLTGPLSPALCAALDSFDPKLLWRERQNTVFTVRDLGWGVAEGCRAGSPAFEARVGGHSIEVTGHLNEAQRKLVVDMLAELADRVGEQAMGALNAVHFRPLIAAMTGPKDRDLPSTVRMLRDQLGIPRLSDDLRAAGMATRSDRSVQLEYRCLEDPAVARQALYHEFGHILDFRRMDSFKRHFQHWPEGLSSQDYESPYAQTSPLEDRAESNSILLAHWDQVTACPQLWLHADGVRGQKLAWLLDKFYHRQVPAANAVARELLAQVSQGRSPFANMAEYQSCLRSTLSRWSPGQPVPAEWSGDPQRQFILDAAQGSL